MIKNRFFKTTIGVAFELAGGNTATAAATYANFPAFAAGAVPGNYQGFVKDGTKLDKGLTWGTALTAAQKRMPVYIAWATEKSGGIATVESVTPMIGETIRAQNVPYAASTLEDASVVLAGGTIHIGQELTLKVVETTPLNDRLPSWDYSSVVRIDLATSLTELATAVNKAVSDEFFTAVAITNGIQIISTDASRHFRLAIGVQGTVAFPDDTTWTHTTATQAFAGSGTPDQIRQLILESDIKRGVTTQYPHEGVSPLDFGAGPLQNLDLAAGTFDVVVLTGTKYEASPTPIEIHHNKAYVFVVVPAGQGAAIAATFA